MNKSKKIQLLIVTVLTIFIIFTIIITFKMKEDSKKKSSNFKFIKTLGSVASIDGALNLDIHFINTKEIDWYNYRTKISKLYLVDEEGKKAYIKNYMLRSKNNELKGNKTYSILSLLEIRKIEIKTSKKIYSPTKIVIEYIDNSKNEYVIGKIDIYNYKANEVIKSDFFNFYIRFINKEVSQVKSLYLSVNYKKDFKINRIVNEKSVGEFDKSSVEIYKNKNIIQTDHKKEELKPKKVSMDKINLQTTKKTTDTLYFNIKNPVTSEMIVYQPIIEVIRDGKKQIVISNNVLGSNENLRFSYLNELNESK